MNNVRFLLLIACLTVYNVAAASEYRGQVTFGGFPVPGATVTVTQGGKTFITVTDQHGRYSFTGLSDGTCTIEIRMTGFAAIKQDVVVPPNAPAAAWELKLLPLAQIKAEIQSAVSSTRASPPQATEKEAEPQNQPAPGQGEEGASEDQLGQLASPGLLINGSVSNAATSPFALPPAFGNNRNGGNGMYRFGLGAVLDNSSLDAAPFSLTGQRTPKPVYNRITGLATFGGPLQIPHLFQNGPYVFAAYQWTRSVNATTQPALVPDAAERNGDLSQAAGPLGQGAPIFDPTTGLPFSGDMIPQSRISPQARALLNYYPPPNFSGSSQYNYQIPLVSDTHQGGLQSRFDQTIGGRNELYGGFAFLSTHTSNPNVFGFLDATNMLGISTNVTWWHRLTQQLFMNVGYRFSRLATQLTPYFENRQNVSGEAGIFGNDQDPINWGPPSLTFANGVAGLSDSNASFDRNQSSAASYSMLWSRGAHNITFGGDFRRQEFNDLSQQNPRGTLTFTGATTEGTGSGASGSPLADFLLGIPDTSAIAFGNADKYFRESVYDAYVNDDYRVRPGFTLNAGIRWEYGAPITELYNRLVNLDVASGFAAVAPVVASDSIGSLTGQTYPNSLIRPDKIGIEPRIGIAWRPIGGSSLVIRAGYGIYYDTSVYQTIATQMAQQAPLSKSVSVQNSAGCPLTLANAFSSCPSVTGDTFGIDPNFRVGYAQNWDLAIQRDLPGSLQLTATYLGTKGTHGVQEFLPNTYPLGAVNPCPTCPAGFAYFASNGNSTREAGQIQLRRRLASGFAATLQYTYSKAIDDDSQLGGQGATSAQSTTVLPWQGLGIAASNQTSQSPSTIAQNWRDLSAERSLSAFDQRNLLGLQLQYTTGMGLGGETLLSGKKGALFKEWTFLSQISYGSGLPETPVDLAAVPGTGFTGSIRPDYTGAPIYAAPGGLSLNPAAYAAPLTGQWGNAGRFSIIGPATFSLDASVGRTFRLHGRYNLDFRLDSTNALNHPTFTSWITTINSAQFGLPTAVNPMRSMQATLRLRF